MGVVVVATDAVSDKGTTVLELNLETSSLEERKTPAALLTLALNVLAAHSPPEKVVIGQRLPGLRDLSGTSKRDCVEVSENAKRDLAGKQREGVDADDLVQRVGQVRQLRAVR